MVVPVDDSAMAGANSDTVVAYIVDCIVIRHIAGIDVRGVQIIKPNAAPVLIGDDVIANDIISITHKDTSPITGTVIHPAKAIPVVMDVIPFHDIAVRPTTIGPAVPHTNP